MKKTKEELINDLRKIADKSMELNYYFDTLSRGYIFRQQPPVLTYINKIFQDNGKTTVNMSPQYLKMIDKELYCDLKGLYNPTRGLRGEIQWAIYLLSNYSNLSRRDIANIIGVSDTTVVRIKNKRTSKALHIPPLMGGATEEMKAEGYKIFLAVAEVFADSYDPNCNNEIEKKTNGEGENKFNAYFRRP